MARAKLMRAKAEMEELKVAAKKRNLIEIDEAREKLEQVLVVTRDAFIRLPDELAGELPTEMKPAFIAMGQRRVQQILLQLANQAGGIVERADDV